MKRHEELCARSNSIYGIHLIEATAVYLGEYSLGLTSKLYPWNINKKTVKGGGCVQRFCGFLKCNCSVQNGYYIQRPAPVEYRIPEVKDR